MQPGLQIIPAGIERQQRGEPQQRNAEFGHSRNHRVARFAGNEKTDRDQLQRRLPFRQPRHRHADAELSQIFAQSRDQDFAAQDDHGREQRPSMNGALGRQHQQARRHQELVGDRIEHAAERGLLVPHPGEIAVEKIRNAGGDEHRQRQPAQPQPAVEDVLPEHAADDDRNRHDAAISEDIRQRQRMNAERPRGASGRRVHGT